MKTVSVHASRSYEIRIGRGLLQGAGEQIRAVTDAKKVMLVSDDAVWPLYGDAVRRSLETAGLTVCSFVFPHGESSKCACTYLELLDALCELEEKFADGPAFAQLDWGNPWDRARLRLRAAISRTCADCACWKMALETANSVLGVTESAGDPLGARNTAALAYARLEDEEGLNALEARFTQGNAWTSLARCLLLYKLDRTPAARRSLRGFAQLNQGAAYAMMRPVFVEVYLPDRPDYASGSFEEAMAAVHEAEVIIADTPDFVAWCQAQTWFEADARAYAEKHDLDW